MSGVRHWLFSAVVLVSCLMPAFSNLPPRLIIPQPIFPKENTTIGSVLCSISATDSDPGTTLTFKIDASTEKNLVILNHTQGTPSTKLTTDVILAKKLDRDREPKIRYIYLSVSDDTNTVSGTLQMYIMDVNDESPVFDPPTYRQTVKEDIGIGSSVVQVTAIDLDDGIGGRVYYGMSANAQDADVKYEKTFQIDKNTGEVTLKQTLDYEKRTFYQFKVHAWDTNPIKTLAINHAKDADLVITVLDVQDSPPYFVNVPYMTSFKESDAKGTSLLTVTAYDGDRGIPNDVTYTFTGGPHQNFSINSTTGEISLAEMIDADDPDVRNQGGVFKINVTATEVPAPHVTQHGENQTTTVVSITVLDVNDNAPTFNAAFYNASVQENTPAGVPITLTSVINITDGDQGENSKFIIYLVKDGLPYLDFDTLPEINQTVFSKTNVIIRVKNSSVLDYETTKSITFQVVAREKSTKEHFNSNATVSLTIEDVNDNSPEFNSTPVHFNVSEDATNGSIIGSVSANDRDTGDYGTVFYELEDDHGNYNFSIMKNGSIYVTGELDREKKASYLLFVVAWDNEKGDESARRSGRKRVEISLLDVNDSPPVFIGTIPKTEVAEDIPNNTVVLFVSAKDPDLGENGTVQYGIYSDTGISGRFGINATTGAIFVNSSLIGLDGDREITVIATDKGNPPLNATQVVEFNIRDVNNNAPVFQNPPVNTSTTANITIPEEQPINTTVIILNATDKDKGKNAKVNYRIVPDNSNDWIKFNLEPMNGILRNSQKLDREKQTSYLFQVQAEDNGIPQLFTSITLNVTLLDIDDNKPMFDKKKLTTPFPLKVTEEDEKACVGSVAVATDADEYYNHTKICYFIYGGKNVSHFVLNKTTGELCLQKKLDRENKDSVPLIIQALADCDAVVHPDGSYNETDSSLLSVKVKVLDVNDNPPVFSKTHFTQGILFDTKLGEVVYRLQDEVTDADVGENATTYFELKEIIPSAEIESGSNSDKPFLVDKNGSVITSMLFSSAMLGHFTLKIQAYDIGNLTADTELKIFIISNIQRVKVIFRGKVPDMVRKEKDAFIRDLESVLHYIIIVDAITSHQKPDKTYDDTSTDMFINARYNTTKGGIVPATELWRAFDFTQGVNYIFERYGVSETAPVVYEPSEKDSTERNLITGFVIVAIGLAILAVALAVALYVVRQKYVRRLKSYRTKAEVKTQEVEAHPGTNVYACNPVYNKEISIVDVDTVSVNSLDDNFVDHDTKAPLESYDEQEVTMSIFGEPGHDVRYSTLDAVLQRYETEESGCSKTKHVSQSNPNKDEDTDSGTFMPLDATGLEHSDI